MLAYTDTGKATSSAWGGKAPFHPEKWKLNMHAVRATIKFAIATG
jgi:hypothetical protein